jgi:choline dehydrogenase-like flavoprotein
VTVRHTSDSPPVLGAAARRTLTALAEAALPAGKVFPGAGPHTVARVERFVADLPGTARSAYVALLHALDAAALVRHRHRFAELTAADRIGVLEGFRTGGLARRGALRALMTPLKMAHFDDPELYRKAGCVYTLPVASREVKPAWFRERCHDGATLGGDLSLECDVVVIGTGAGGAVVARELAEAGVAVVLLEDGRYVDRSEFTGRPFAMQRALYRSSGATFSVGNVAIPIPIGRSVGGTTTINSGTCYRVPDRILRHWQDDLGLGELSPAAMDGYYQRVERVLQVAPTRPEFLGGNARVIARGCEALGFTHHGPLRRNAPDCDGKGVCCFGCPTDAKRSTNVSYVPLAMKAGAELFHGCAVERIVVTGGRATGVVARAAGGHRVTVHARAVVVSCGALMTPVLLQDNGLCGASGQLGRNLSIHPAAGAMAEMDERIASWDGVPQGYGIEEFHDEGLLFEGVATPLEYAMVFTPQVGPRLTELAEGFERAASFGFMVEDTSRGRVRAVRGHPVVTYMLNDADVAKIKRGIEILARVFFAAGARRMLAPVHGFAEIGPDDLDRFRRADLRASDLELSAYHPLGTARMGRDPARSVVDANNQAHDVPGLYIVDGASVPSSLGVNPQLTIMALATRAAEKIAAALA